MDNWRVVNKIYARLRRQGRSEKDALRDAIRWVAETMPGAAETVSDLAPVAPLTTDRLVATVVDAESGAVYEVDLTDYSDPGRPSRNSYSCGVCGADIPQGTAYIYAVGDHPLLRGPATVRLCSDCACIANFLLRR